MTETNGKSYSARSRFWPAFFPDEDGTRSDEIPSLVACQPPSDQREDLPGDGLEDDVAIAGVPDADVGQGRSLHGIYTGAGCGGVCVGGEKVKPWRFYMWCFIKTGGNGQ